MLILIDNYDSFTYNLVHYLGELGGECRVFRNDQITVAEAPPLHWTKCRQNLLRCSTARARRGHC